MDSAMGYDGSTITVGALVRHRGGGRTWRVTKVRDHDGRAALSLVNPDESNNFTAFYADLAIVIDETEA